VNSVANDDRALPASQDVESNVARSMPRCRFEPEACVNFVVAVDKDCAACLYNGKNTVLEPGNMRRSVPRSVLPGLVFLFLEGVFLAGENIACVWESWHPTSVLKLRIPADVICMQVGAQHHIDFLRPDATRDHVLEKR